MKLKDPARIAEALLIKEITKEIDNEIINDLLKLAKGITMTNVFKDQERFMIAGDQTVDKYNNDQYNMYLNLIKEEVEELHEAVDNNDRVEQLDALLDITVVVAGALHSLGVDVEGAWDEVIRSNMSKVDLITGKVIKREDGKILKPESYFPPNLSKYIK